MTTVHKTAVTTEYTKANQFADFLIENVGGGKTRYVLADGQPAVNADFHTLLVGCVVSSSLVTGTVWVMAVGDDNIIAVSE